MNFTGPSSPWRWPSRGVYCRRTHATRTRDRGGGVSHRGSPDHLVGPLEKGRGNGDTEGLGGLEVDHQLELRGLLHQQVRRLGPFENPIHIGGGLAQPLRPARFIRHETISVDKFARIVYRWQAMLGREVHNPLQVT